MKKISLETLKNLSRYLPKNRTKLWKENVHKFEALEAELYSMLPDIPTEEKQEQAPSEVMMAQAPLVTAESVSVAAEIPDVNDDLELDILNRFSSLGHTLSHLKNDSVEGYFRLSFVMKTRGPEDKENIHNLIQQVKFDYEGLELNLYRFTKDTSNRLVRIEASMRKEKTRHKDTVHGDL